MIREGFGHWETEMLPVLVVGHNLSAMIAAKALTDLGLSVTLIKAGPEKSRLYYPNNVSDFHGTRSGCPNHWIA